MDAQNQRYNYGNGATLLQSCTFQGIGLWTYEQMDGWVYGQSHDNQNFSD